MTRRREVARRAEEDLTNVGFPPIGNQVLLQGNEIPPSEQALVIPPPMRNGEIRSAFSTLVQDMTTQAEDVFTQCQAMSTQTNREVGPLVQQNASTTASRLREFTKMNPLMFYGWKVNEEPQYFIDEVYNILYSMGLTSN